MKKCWIMVKGGNDMSNLEKRINEWKNYKEQLIKKIANTNDEQRRIFLQARLTAVETILERLRDIQWREQ